VSERSERALMKTSMRTRKQANSKRSEQQAKPTSSEANIKRSELVATSVSVAGSQALIDEDEHANQQAKRASRIF